VPVIVDPADPQHVLLGLGGGLPTFGTVTRRYETATGYDSGIVRRRGS
jgi:hypothetical protein